MRSPGSLLALLSFAALLAAPARAQPAPAEDLGSLAPPRTLTRTLDLPPREAHWFRLTIPEITNPGAWLDMWTDAPPSPDTPLSNGDTVLALYSATGTRVASDDDSGPGRYALLTFGESLSARPSPGGGSLPRNGRHGTLPPGTYYLAIAASPAAVGATNWALDPRSTHSGQVRLTLELGCSVCPLPPSATIDALPSRAFPYDAVLVRVFTTPGTNPPAPVVAVSLDLSPWGLSPTFPLGDDGVEGDLSTGDGIFARFINIPPNAPPGPSPILCRLADEAGRHATATLQMEIAPLSEWHEYTHGGSDAPSSLAHAQRPSLLPWPLPPTPGLPLTALSGTLGPSDADAFVIRIDDPSLFSASTADAAGDTQLFLFDPCTGRGITFNDDWPGGNSTRSLITGRFVPGPGVYILAISAYDLDPASGVLGPLWLDTPTTTERSPDGPGADGACDHWIGAGPPMTFYKIDLIGCSRIGPGAEACPSACPADVDGNGTLDPDDLATFIACFFDPGCPLADFDASGQIDGDDLADYIAAYFDPGSPCVR